MSNEFLKIPSGRSLHNVSVNDIIHIRSKGAYSILHLTTGEKHKCAKNLSTIFKNLSDKKCFHRLHRSHIVNLDKIKQYRPFGRCGLVVMVCGTIIPVSKRGKSSFLDAYKGVFPDYQ